MRTWSLSLGTCTRAFLAHDGIVRGIAYMPDGKHFITVSDDKTIKTWDVVSADEDEEPVNTIVNKVCGFWI